MSWKCDICDTYNDERKTTCYVCGQVRSADSIREGKIKARKDLLLQIDNTICKQGLKLSKYILLGGFFSTVIVIILSIIIKLSQGSITDVVINLKSVVNHISDQLSISFLANVDTVTHQGLDIQNCDIGENINVILKKWGTNLDFFYISSQEVFMHTAKNNLENGLINSIETLKKHSDKNLLNNTEIIRVLMNNIAKKISYVIDGFKTIFKI